MLTAPLVLGVETSCDDTGLGLARGRSLLRHLVVGQPQHAATEGVVPQVAAAAHLEALDPLFDRLLAEEGVTRSDVEAIGVTAGPGLAGCLAVGASWALGLGAALDVPVVAVHHLEAHLHSLWAAEPQPEDFPVLALLASGGHTALLGWDGKSRPSELARTRDDAAGEALDKVARLLDLGFPGGAALEALAAEGDSKAVRFPVPLRDAAGFSFSGLKTAARRRHEAGGVEARDLAASFQAAVVAHLMDQARKALAGPWAGFALVGGVAANGPLRVAAAGVAAEAGVPLHLPPLALATDNGGMVALAAAAALAAGDRPPVTDLRPRWPLEAA